MSSLKSRNIIRNNNNWNSIWCSFRDISMRYHRASLYLSISRATLRISLQASWSQSKCHHPPMYDELFYIGTGTFIPRLTHNSYSDRIFAIPYFVRSCANLESNFNSIFGSTNVPAKRKWLNDYLTPIHFCGPLLHFIREWRSEKPKEWTHAPHQQNKCSRLYRMERKRNHGAALSLRKWSGQARIVRIDFWMETRGFSMSASVAKVKPSSRWIT